ncbi:ral GTPase-activating protein subunit beta isoform X4 [Poecilia reticulata]|uniref:ral GTPase-activating protein subunit beta isoform X4 n=1 Tax=Poecilia reticulata TaxID=8081 RepID=UPI0007EB8D91|nr:PREDICTED: ral GTPase-activating protein subunit beta-like isoform X4 [Poecilia reticulata]
MMDQFLKGQISVLSGFPPSVGRDVAVAVVKPLAAGLGNPSTRSLLRTDRQQVLSSTQSLARESSMMSSETWQTLLHFLLRINHTLLAPPTPAGGLSKLSVAVLLEVWLLACSRCFPCRSLWQTFRQMFSSWRHQPAVVEQWSRVAAGLTSRLLPQMFGPSFPPFEVPGEDASLVPADMEGERVSHTWFKFLHLFSNPVDLIGPAAGSSLDEDVQLPGIFFRVMRSVGEMVDAFLGVTVRNSGQTKHLLPNTELGARSQSRDRLPSLGKQPQSTDPVHQNSSVVPVHLPVIFPPGFSVSRSPFRDRLPSYEFSRPRSGSAPPTPVNFPTTPEAPPIKSSSLSRKQQTPSSPHHWKSSSRLRSSCPPVNSAPRCPAHPLRCNTDSLLHLFGSWLFEAALITSGKQADVTVMSDRWAAGRAEACGTLCRIFTCKKTGENIQSIYLSRFYLVLLRSLQDACPPVVVSVLLNSTRLFCCDLRGVNLLLPSFVSVLETVLLDRDLILFKGLVSLVDLRRSSIFILLSLMPLPVQLGPAQIQNSVDLMMGCEDATAGTFLSYKLRLRSLLIGALQTETDTCNIQLLLAAILNVVHDSAAAEAPPPSPDPHQSRRSDHWNQEVQFRATSGTSRTRTPTTQSEAAVLWVHVVRLLTQRLTSQWRNDSGVCLSALEVLGGLAKVEVQVEASERRRAVGSVCTYIVFQCGRPPPLHSRDLHSIIVAAFCCLNTWLTQNPVLLHQQECLLEVLEIVELGISGSRSRQDQNVVWKDDKDLNPASLRVKEAAEATLSCIMQVSGAGPDPSLRDNALMLDNSSLKRSRYFVLEGSVILATLEPTPDQPDQEPSPSLLVILRGPSGHHSWSLQLHLLPKDARAIQTQAALIPRQVRLAAEDAGQRRSIKHQLVPELMERVPLVGADQSIPPLIRTGPAEDQQQLDHLRVTLKTQQEIEVQPGLSSHSVAMATCRPAPPISCFQVTRLFLSHLGFLTPESVKDPGVNSMQPALLSLDSSLPGFSENLRRLDQLPSRNSDCAFVFYMRAGQKTPREILGNVEKQTHVSGPFLDFLSSLGCPEEVGGASRSEFEAVLGDSGGGVFDGRRFVLKFADALTQIAFIVPSSHTYTDWLKSFEEAGHAAASSSNQKRAETRPSEDIRFCQSVSSFFQSDSKLLIVWVERFEDIEKFPLTDLLLETRAQTEAGSSNIQLIFIHPLKTGLFRICFLGNASTKLGLVVPLVNGMVTSRRSLGFLLTEMVSNCSHRCRSESDSAPPPHVRRKHLINDIILSYKSCCSEPAFYSALFQS